MAFCFFLDGNEDATSSSSSSNISPILVFPLAVSQPQSRCLLEGMRDPYDANRVLCLHLLLRLPATQMVRGPLVSSKKVVF